MKNPLLPQDRYIAELLGLSEEEMRWYKAEVQRRAMEGPQPSIIAGEPATTLAIISLALTVISTGLTIVSALLVPKPQQRDQGQLTTRQRQGETLQVPSAFAPTYGFEAVQDVAPLGDPIPLVYAKREFLDGRWYGGVRINTPLLWSQIWSLGGGQMLRAVFLVSEGEIEKIHPLSFAIGNNTLGAYSFEGLAQRIAIYSVRNGGRMAIGNYLSGSRLDAGASGAYTSDIFRTDVGSGDLRPAFCGAYKPSTSTSFGLYAPIANGTGYRVNPRIRPLRILQVRGEKYRADDDAQAVAEAWKYKYCYSSKSGIISTSKGGSAGALVNLQVGDTFTYMLSSKSDGVYNNTKDPAIKVNSQNSDNSIASSDGTESLISIGQSVAGRQKQYDSNLREGELYKAGSCLAILVSRSPLFVSESDYSFDSIQEGETGNETGSVGTSAFYTFRVVRAGTVGVAGLSNVDERFFDGAGTDTVLPAVNAGNNPSKIYLFDTVGTDYAAGEIGKRYYTASSFPQIFRCALGNVRLNRPSRYFEIGIRSTVAMQLQGICNFADIPGESPVFGTTGSVSTLLKLVQQATFTDGTYTISPTGGTGTGLQIAITVTGGVATSVAILNAGTGYTLNDEVTATIPDQGFVTYRVTAINPDIVGSIPDPGYKVINGKAADDLAGRDVEQNTANAVFSSGTVTAPEKRYSFFRLAVRSDLSSEAAFSDTGAIVFCVASAKETPLFNYIRFAMNGDATWEVRIEPVSSWEIRNTSPTIVLLDSSGSSLPFGFSFGTIWVKGSVFSLGFSSNFFELEGLKPKQEIGLSWTEGTFGSPTDGTYLDRFARAAEFFVYDEITTSCASSPEHEITYVNVIQLNDTTPRYDKLCLVGINVRATEEWSQFSQFSAYVTGGVKVQRFSGANEASHLFPEILRDFMLNKDYGLGNEISAEQIDDASFSAAAQFCFNNRFFYDGPKLSNVNWRQWAADVAATHCLLLIERGGIFYLEEAIPERPEIKGLFTAGNCMSIELVTAEAEQRQPFSVSVKYRSERYGGAAPSVSADPAYGLFPEPQEKLIYHTTWGDGPTESVDVSDYCTSENHAVKAARYIIGSRRLSDHTVRIQTTYEAITSSLAPGDFIKVAMDYTYYNQFVNGAVTGDGKLVSSTPLADTTHPIVYWTGDQNAEVQEGVLTVSNGGTVASPTGIVFTVKSSETLTRTYRIDSIQPSDDGYQIEAVYTPVLPDGTLQLYAEWSDASYWSEA